MVSVPADFYPPYVLVLKNEIQLLKGTKEYWDLIHHRTYWYAEYERTFRKGYRYSYPYMEFNLEGA